MKTIKVVEDKDNNQQRNSFFLLLSNILGILAFIQGNVNVFALPNKFGEKDIVKDITVSEPKRIQTDDTY